jgi:hypothetical protein
MQNNPPPDQLSRSTNQPRMFFRTAITFLVFSKTISAMGPVDNLKRQVEWAKEAQFNESNEPNTTLKTTFKYYNQKTAGQPIPIPLLSISIAQLAQNSGSAGGRFRKSHSMRVNHIQD